MVINQLPTTPNNLLVFDKIRQRIKRECHGKIHLLRLQPIFHGCDQIKTGTFEHAAHHLVDNRLDLSLFEAVYKNDDNGRPAYDPAILLKIILFAYFKGMKSSREIE